jgi:hypothetical protein
MVYIRNLFTQDLRDGKQIAFPTDPSNYIFKFNFSDSDPDRNIIFKFKEKNSSSPNYFHNDKLINTRLYAAGSESRIDGELKQFLRDILKAEIDDIILIRPINLQNYEFEFIPKNADSFSIYSSLLNGKNHEIVIENPKIPENDTVIFNVLEEFADWFIAKDGLSHNYFKHTFSSNREKVINELKKYDILYTEQFKLDLFEISVIDINILITQISNNISKDEGDFFELSKKTSNHMPRAILGKNNYLKFLKEYILENEKIHSSSPKTHPVNKIYFGAPGTGKSYQVTQDLKNVDLIFQKRVTFHPEYDNATFVGGYKPITDNGDIKYEFVPQIFTNIYVESCNDPSHQYYLIIEEINRGNCAEIFGELFQLLDRDVNYKITSSNELTNYLNISIPNSKFYKNGKMLLPDNLSILATMNTSDQSLFPMDSAFKRRWEWEYIPINYTADLTTNPSFAYKIKVDDTTTFKWVDFIEKVNLRIQDNPSLGMDKCIGNYFVKPNEKNEISIENFIYKVIFYLWNDVFKDEPKNSIFKGKITYQDFFPIKDKGEKLLRSILYDLKLIESIETIEEPNTQS